MYLPVGWTVNDSIFYTNSGVTGLLVYNDSLSQVFGSSGAITIGYYWWVAEGTTLLPCIYGSPFLFNPVINTDDQVGTFHLDYTIGDNGPNLIYDRSDDHIITVGMPDNVTVINSNDNGPGSLREAIDQVDFFGNVNFNLNGGDTIFLQEELLVYKDIHIEGDGQAPVIISGNKENRVFFIQAGRQPRLSNLHIVQGNTNDYGGGIFCDSYSNPVLSNLTIRENVAERGGGIYCTWNASVGFDSINRSDIYLNKAIWGNDICSYQGSFLEIFADTFTVQYPTEYHIWPLDTTVFQVNHGKLMQIDGDIYISPEGDDLNSGLSPEEPFKTIDHAFLVMRADNMHHNAINLLNGSYSTSMNDQVFPMIIPDYIDITGESKNGVLIDAEGQSTVIEVHGNLSTKLEMLSITGGTTGIFCYTSALLLDNVTIANNQGSGIFDRDSDCSLENVTICNNYTEDRGGGIYSLNSYYNLKNVLISNNYSGYTGGGIYFEDVNAVLENVTISYNEGLYGGGISCHRSVFDFDSTNRCNIYNNSAVHGNDLELNSYAKVVVDTFTVLYPTEFHTLGDIDFDILHGKIEQVEADLFVSPGGSDSNTGLTANDPLKTIRNAMSRIRADSAEHHTIQLLEGTYSPSTNEEMMPLAILDYYSLNGTSASDVIINAEGQSGTMIIESSAGTYVENLTVTGADEGSYYSNRYAGINCYGTPTLRNLIVTDNFQQGIYCSGSPVLQNVLIINNAYQGIYCMSSSPTLTNVTIADNGGDGVFCMNGAAVTMRNSIIANNAGPAVSFLGFNGANYFTASWSNIHGWVATNGNGSYTHSGECLNEDPFFVGTGDHPFALSPGSPCIDAGYPNSILYHLPEFDILGNARFWDGDGNGDTIVDMGAYEFGSMPVGIEQPQAARLKTQVYPNPASETAFLRYRISDTRYLISDLYGIDGRKIREIINQVLPAGEHEFDIDVSDLPAGVYFVRVQAGSDVNVAKLLVGH